MITVESGASKLAKIIQSQRLNLPRVSDAGSAHFDPAKLG
jgi:hypothetical protein